MNAPIEQKKAKSNWRIWLLGTSVVLALLVLSLYIGKHAHLPRAALVVQERVSIAVPQTPHATLLHLAQARGYFAAAGLEVSVFPVSHGKLALEQLTQGRVDLAAAAELPFVLNVMSGQALAVAATISSASRDMAVVARRDRGIADPKDLLGKKIGLTRGTSGEYFLWSFLNRARLGTESVQLVDLQPDRLVDRLFAGDIDAISTWQPTRSMAQEKLAANGLSLFEENAYAATYVLVGMKSTLAQRPAVMERLLRALLEAEAFLREQPVQARQVVAGYLGVSESSLEAGWHDQVFQVNLLQQQLITMEDQARWAQSSGLASRQAPPNFLHYLYLSALLAVDPGRVTVVH